MNCLTCPGYLSLQIKAAIYYVDDLALLIRTALYQYFPLGWSHIYAELLHNKKLLKTKPLYCKLKPMLEKGAYLYTYQH